MNKLEYTIKKSVLLERKDREKINYVNNIIKNYIEGIKHSFDKYITRVKYNNPDLDQRVNISYDSDIDYDILLNRINRIIEDKLSLEIQRSKTISKGGFLTRGSYSYNSIVLYDTELYKIYNSIATINYNVSKYNTGDYIDYFSDLIFDFISKVQNNKTLFHEILHYVDDVKIRKNTRDKKNLSMINKNYVNKLRNPKSVIDFTENEKINIYLNKTWEINAHLLDKLFSNNYSSFEDFLNELKNEETETFRWYGNLNPTNKRRVLKRLYDYFQK